MMINQVSTEQYCNESNELKVLLNNSITLVLCPINPNNSNFYAFESLSSHNCSNSKLGVKFNQ